MISKAFTIGKKAAIGFVLLLLLASMDLSAQRNFEPPPTNIKIPETPNSPVRISLDRIRRMGPGSNVFSYTVSNVGSKTVWGIVIRGLPGKDEPELVIGEAITPGTRRNKARLFDKIDADERLVTVDFVLFRDGSGWGPDKSQQSEHIKGLFEGQRALLYDVKKLLAEKDNAALRMFLTREPYLIDYTPHEQRTTRQHAFFRGYGAGMSALRLEMHGRGDLEGIPFRVAEMEQNLGLVPVQKSDTSQRQISRSYWFFEPVKIESVYLQDKPIEIDKKFAAGPDWLNGLRVRIKNTSGKRITYLSLGLEFPETASTGAMVISMMNYGMPAHRKVSGIPDLLSATPDSVLELELADKEFAGILRILESRIPLSDLTRVNIRISMIHYDDNTGWAGHPLIQDPADPTRWLPSAK